MMEELKPCPFCGQKPRIKSGLDSEGKPFFQVTHDCMNLLSQIKTFCHKTQAEAISDWNRRTAPENKPLTLEQLKNMRGEAVWIKDLDTDEIMCLQFDDFKPATYHKGDDVRFYQFGTKTGMIWWCCKYGKTWIAYARKPEGSKTT